MPPKGILGSISYANAIYVMAHRDAVKGWVITGRCKRLEPVPSAEARTV